MTTTNRTPEQILDRLAHVDDFFGFKTRVLVPYLDFEHAKPYLEDDATIESWSEATAGLLPPAQAGAEYLPFAVEKIRDERGISAQRSVDKFAEWAWLDGLDDLADEIDDPDNYGWYGDRAVRLYADRYGLTWPEETS